MVLLLSMCAKNKSSDPSKNQEPRTNKKRHISTQKDQTEMISVIIPYLAYMPYKEQIKKTIEGLERQTADLEIIVSEQPIVEKHTLIRVGKLQNEGLVKAKGDIIFHCDADILFNDETLLERMEIKLRDYDVIYPLFWSATHKMYKLADGCPFMTREVREEYGPMNENDLGVSSGIFKFVHWLYHNKRFHASKEFAFLLNYEPFFKIKNKTDEATELKYASIKREIAKDLVGDGVWPINERDA